MAAPRKMLVATLAAMGLGAEAFVAPGSGAPRPSQHVTVQGSLRRPAFADAAEEPEIDFVSATSRVLLGACVGLVLSLSGSSLPAAAEDAAPAAAPAVKEVTTYKIGDGEEARKAYSKYMAKKLNKEKYVDPKYTKSSTDICMDDYKKYKLDFANPPSREIKGPRVRCGERPKKINNVAQQNALLDLNRMVAATKEPAGKRNWKDVKGPPNEWNIYFQGKSPYKP